MLSLPLCQQNFCNVQVVTEHVSPVVMQVPALSQEHRVTVTVCSDNPRKVRIKGLLGASKRAASVAPAPQSCTPTVQTLNAPSSPVRQASLQGLQPEQTLTGVPHRSNPVAVISKGVQAASTSNQCPASLRLPAAPSATAEVMRSAVSVSTSAETNKPNPMVSFRSDEC